MITVTYLAMHGRFAPLTPGMVILLAILLATAVLCIVAAVAIMGEDIVREMRAARAARRRARTDRDRAQP